MTKKQINIGFAGTPELAFKHFQTIINDSDFNVKFVLTQPVSKSGRGLKNYEYSLQKSDINVPIISPHSLSDVGLEDKICSYEIDILVVVAYGKILPSWILDFAKFGCLNVHFSLLPLYRGASPIQRSIENGERESGITFMKLEEKMDAGPIYLQKKIIIKDLDFFEVEEKLIKLSLENLNGVIKNIVWDSLQAYEQNDSLASYAEKISKNEGEINWRGDLTSIQNRFNAFKKWPQNFFMLNGKKIKVLDIETDPLNIGNSGFVSHVTQDSIGVYCNNGCILIKELQFPGKKIINARDFFNSKRDIISVGKELS
mgnify:FL=1